MKEQTTSKSLQAALDDIKKRYGDEAIVKVGDKSKLNVACISTGSIAVDFVMGGRGIPRGRITEIYGPESSGKTTVCLQAAAQVQKEGGVVAFIDMEHALDPEYAAKLGVNLAELYVAQPDYGEQALEIAQSLVESGAVQLVIVDSVAALVTKAELEGDMTDFTVGSQARLMSKALRKMSGVINQTKTAVLFTNQLRMKIGVMFGNPETTPGGLAMKFYSSVRCQVRKSVQIKVGDEVVGNRVKIKAEKNKIAPPYREAEFDIMYGEGISRSGETLDFGLTTEVLTKRGNAIYYGDQKLGAGRDAAKAFLRENMELTEKLRNIIMDKMLNANILKAVGVNTDAKVVNEKDSEVISDAALEAADE